LRAKLEELFQRNFRELRPGIPLPEMRLEFYPFANINNTIRIRNGELRVRLSDLLEGAPENVLESIAHILLAKIYRKRVEAAHMARYRKYVAGHDISAKARLVRQIRGRKRIDTPQGDIFHLEEIFEDLNSRFFH